jgi:DNA-binding SARP family transcriptional activator
LAKPRIYVTGQICLEDAGRLVTERDLPGRQGRLAFAFLVVNRTHPVSRDDIMSVVWPDEPPGDSDTALSAILSKLRAAFRTLGWDAQACDIQSHSGTLTLRTPNDTWIDIEAAANAIDQAEGALRRQDYRGAWGDANIAASIARRPFLPHADAPWIEARRVALRAALARALQCLTIISAHNDEPELAVQYANELIELEPFRETAYQQLMRLHAGSGNRAEALRVFARCRELLRDELGTAPSAQTEAVFLEILRSGTTAPQDGSSSAEPDR